MGVEQLAGDVSEYVLLGEVLRSDLAAETIERCVEAGADTFVAGSAVYSAADPDAMVRALRASAEAVSAT